MNALEKLTAESHRAQQAEADAAQVNNYFTEMCSGSKAGSYLRLIDFVYHSTLGLSVVKKKETDARCGSGAEREGPRERGRDGCGAARRPSGFEPLAQRKSLYKVASLKREARNLQDLRAKMAGMASAADLRAAQVN